VPTFLLASFRQQPVSLRIAIRIGFVILLMSLAVGALMIAKGMRLVFAGDPQAAYATGGALKPTHAATMHAILVLPLLAWLLSFTDWSERRRVGVVLLGTAGYLLLAAVIAVENLRVCRHRIHRSRRKPLQLFWIAALLWVARARLSMTTTRSFRPSAP
jgi:hypothetical protein